MSVTDLDNKPLVIEASSVANAYTKSRTVGKHDVTITLMCAPNQPVFVSMIMRGDMSFSRRIEFKPSNIEKAKSLFRDLCVLHGMND